MKLLIFFSFFFLAFAFNINEEYLKSFKDLSANKCSKKFVQSFLSRANYYRSKHGVSPLSLSEGAYHNAQGTANSFVIPTDYASRHSYGKNVAIFHITDGQEIDGKQPIDMWYNEVSKYSAYGAEPNLSTSSSWGQFTQLVWKDTSEVGVGCAKSADKKNFYVVGSFDVIGNKEGSFKKNVFPPKK